MKKFWGGLKTNLSYLTKKGTLITFALSFFLTSVSYNYVLGSPTPTVSSVIEIVGLGFAFFFSVIYFFGWLILEDNWPDLHFESPLKDLDPSETAKVEPERCNPYENDIPALQTAWKIMQDARDEANGVKRGNQIYK